MVGTTVMVINVATNNPPSKAMAIGLKNELSAKAKGIKPKIVVTELSRMGLILFPTESLHASTTDMPFFLALLMYSIRRIPLFTTIPSKLVAPKPTVKVKLVPVINSEITMPIKASGIVDRMTNGCLMELN